MKQYDLALYQYSSCPFCAKVRRFMAANELDIPLKDTMMDSSARQQLVDVGGRSTVPALMIDGEIMYESDDIIHWMQEHLVNGS